MKDEWIKAAGAMTGIVHFGTCWRCLLIFRCGGCNCGAEPGLSLPDSGLPHHQDFQSAEQRSHGLPEPA